MVLVSASRVVRAVAAGAQPLQVLLALACPGVSSVAAWAAPLQVSQEALAEPPAPWFLALALEEPLTVSPEQEAALRCRAAY